MRNDTYFIGSDLPCGLDRGLSSCVGETEQLTYVEGYDEDGQYTWFKNGVIDLVELHQADRESCDIGLLVKRFQTGDLSALNQSAAAFYADVRDLPHDPIQAQNIKLAAETFFAHLPVDLKARYDNNFYKWFADFQAGVDEAVAPFKLAAEVNKESEVVSDEQRSE